MLASGSFISHNPSFVSPKSTNTSPYKNIRTNDLQTDDILAKLQSFNERNGVVDVQKQQQQQIILGSKKKKSSLKSPPIIQKQQSFEVPSIFQNGRDFVIITGSGLYILKHRFNAIFED